MTWIRHVNTNCLHLSQILILPITQRRTVLFLNNIATLHQARLRNILGSISVVQRMGHSAEPVDFFAPELPDGHSTGQFVTAPFRTWRKLSDRTLAHDKLDYHLASLAKMSAFLDCYSNPSQAIDTVLVSEARKRMEANKKVISSLLNSFAVWKTRHSVSWSS